MPSDGKKAGYTCEDCGKVFTYSQGIKRHRQANHDNLKYTCACGGVYSYLGTLQRHQKRCPVHREANPQDPSA